MAIHMIGQMKPDTPRKGKPVKLPREPRHAFLICRGAILWGLLFAAALIFTQALRSPASSIFLGFVLMLPAVMALYLLTARAALKTYLFTDSTVTPKNHPFSYTLRIINDGPLPYPFADAYLSLPQENRVRCAVRPMRMALSPFAAYSLDSHVTFSYRGTYAIGVSCIYVYDFFRLFGLRVDFNLYENIYVTPRRLLAEESRADASDDAAEANRPSSTSYDRLEVSDVREYRMGDPLKSVHWKLSSKADELIVRDYHAGSTRTVYVYCDLAAHFPALPPQPDETAPARKKGTRAADAPEQPPDPFALASPDFYEDMNEFAADGVVELTIATVLRELRQGNACVLLWFDHRSPQGAFAQLLQSPEDFELIWKSFSTAPLCPAADSVTRLPALLSEIQAAKQIFVTACLDQTSLAEFCSISAEIGNAGRAAVELLFFNPAERFANPTERRHYLELCAAKLAEHGILYHERKSAAERRDT